MITQDPCEYDPKTKEAVYMDKVHAVAELIMGYNGKWRVCKSCAELPEFKRFKVKVLIVGCRTCVFSRERVESKYIPNYCSLGRVMKNFSCSTWRGDPEYDIILGK